MDRLLQAGKDTQETWCKTAESWAFPGSHAPQSHGEATSHHSECGDDAIRVGSIVEQPGFKLPFGYGNGVS